MTSQWYTNVNKARPRHTPTWRKTFKWTHFTTISKHEWISTIIVYVHEVIWSMHFQSIKWIYDKLFREFPWRSWCYLICIITHGLCSFNARLFNDEETAIRVSYWRWREFPNYTGLHRGRMSSKLICCLIHWLVTYWPLGDAQSGMGPHWLSTVLACGNNELCGRTEQLFALSCSPWQLRLGNW